MSWVASYLNCFFQVVQSYVDINLLCGAGFMKSEQGQLFSLQSKAFFQKQILALET